MTSGKLQVDIENLFPIIKKFLYTDQEIFLRELVSNAVDACKKMETISRLEEIPLKESFKVFIEINKKAGTLSICDNGLGMTQEEVLKYINNIAFSGAKEFAERCAEGKENIIGNFGLGFYSAFMVADKVEVVTRSYQKSAFGVRWSSEGKTNYVLEKVELDEPGTQVILHMNDEGKSYLEEEKILSLAKKYLNFMAVPIFFGEEEFIEKNDKDEEIKKTKPRQLNNPEPLWNKKPSELTEKNYLDFYRELYPYKLEEPLFHIHINIDHPFQVSGILYFPKLGAFPHEEREQVALYQKQVFVTDNLKDVLPEFLALMHGVIDSSDIPLNVSRSALQADATVKKISTYISKKVAEKLNKLFKDEREVFEKKWGDIELITAYGLLSDEKFYEKIFPIYLFKDQKNKFFTLEELKKSQSTLQTNKNKSFVLLYSTDALKHHALIEQAEKENYKVILIDLPFVSHLWQKIESKENILCKQIDSGSLQQLIEKDDTPISILSEEEKKKVEELFKNQLPEKESQVKVSDLSSDAPPVSVVTPEFMRRMKEMNQFRNFQSNTLPDMYEVVVNANNPLIAKLLKEEEAIQKKKIEKLFNLALLGAHKLSGERLTRFLQQSYGEI